MHVQTETAVVLFYTGAHDSKGIQPEQDGRSRGKPLLDRRRGEQDQGMELNNSSDKFRSIGRFFLFSGHVQEAGQVCHHQKDGQVCRVERKGIIEELRFGILVKHV